MGQTLRNSTYIYSLETKNEFAAGWGWGLCGEGERGGRSKRRGSMDFRIGVYSCIMTEKKRQEPVLCLYLPVSISLPLSLSLSLTHTHSLSRFRAQATLPLYLFLSRSLASFLPLFVGFIVGVCMHKCRYRDINVSTIGGTLV